ncbi:hypothetical protein GNZ06_08070 [Aeromonas jandaei]|uniref:hypothetical protein n=1 Tax=Aeromonas jandaei TaxID=650 RepID=UPI0019344390|nr:hypothetical protein [Aeromonas jandaei]MBM0491865.1 hypothetical protein [Aeromonas jandaei]MBM0568751.1 hypothetical protein [Aeromonas jandaei]
MIINNRVGQPYSVNGKSVQPILDAPVGTVAGSDAQASRDRVTLSGAATPLTYSRQGVMSTAAFTAQEGLSTTESSSSGSAAGPQSGLTRIARDSLVAQRLGVDKEKLDKIAQAKEEISNNPELSIKEKQRMLADLDKEREALLQEAAERRKERGDEEQQVNVQA